MERYTTVHHVHESDRVLRDEIRMGEMVPTVETLEEHYAPVKTLLRVADPSRAFEKAQGDFVNEDATHMVNSVSPGDILEIHDGESVEFHLVDYIGFTELGHIDDPVDNHGMMPHLSALSAESHSDEHSRFPA